MSSSNSLPISDGYIYAWKVPITINCEHTILNQLLSQNNDQLVLLKVGRSCLNKLGERLYVERLAWSKILGTTDGSYRTKSLIKPADINILHDSSSNATEEDIEEMYNNWLTQNSDNDNTVLLLRKQNDNIPQIESYVRSLFGFPFKREVLEDIITSINDLGVYWKSDSRKYPSSIKVQKSCIAPSEYVITFQSYINKISNWFQINRNNDTELEEPDLSILTNVLTNDIVFVPFQEVKVNLQVPLCENENFEAKIAINYPHHVDADSLNTLLTSMRALNINGE